MDNLWAPWRMQYVRAPKKNTEETFLKKLEDGNDEENLVLFRGEHSFVCMNLYPYNNGHIMILPYNIVENPEELDDATQFEIMKIASLSMKIIREKMNAEGFNFGANIGAAAGAVAFYVIDPNKGSELDFLGYLVVAPQFVGVGALVGYFVVT